MVCEILLKGLPLFGFAVWSADSGAAAVEVYRSHADAVDLVLLDCHLLHSDCQDTLAVLREREPGLRCCLTTGFLDRQSSLELFGQGALGILTKPFRLDGLAQALRLLLALSGDGRNRPHLH